MYGRNSTGGAINLITARPVLGEFGFKQTFTTGNLGRFKSRTSANLPLGKKVALKLTGLVSKRDGTVDRQGEGNDFSQEERKAWRVAVSAALTDTLELEYTYDRSRIGDTAKYDQLIRGNSSNFTPVPPPPRGRGTRLDFKDLDPRLRQNPRVPSDVYVAQTTVETQYDPSAQSARLDSVRTPRPVPDSKLNVRGHNLTLSWEANDSLTLKSISAYRKVGNLFSHEILPGSEGRIIPLRVLPLPQGVPALPGLPAPGTVPNLPNVPPAPPLGPLLTLSSETDFKQLTQEIQLIGTTSAVEYVAGFYYYEDDGFFVRRNQLVLNSPRMRDSVSVDNKSWALYAQATYTPGDSPWSLTVGGRYAKDKRKAFRVNPNSASFAMSAPDGANYDKSFSNFDPSFTLAYRFNDDINAYAKVVTGYKSGGTSTRSASLGLFGQGFEEEEVLSYELGLKGEFLASRLRLNAALFRMEIDGFQASVQTGATSGDRDFVGLDGVEVQGAELDLQFALTQQLRASLSLGLLDTDMGVDQILVPGQANPELLNKNLGYAPDVSGTFSLDYVSSLGTFSLGTLDMNAYLGYSYQSKQFSSTNQADGMDRAPARGLLDASLTLALTTASDHKIHLTFWGRNLTDDEYQLISSSAYANGFGALEVATFGDPRTYGVTASFEY